MLTFLGLLGDLAGATEPAVAPVAKVVRAFEAAKDLRGQATSDPQRIEQLALAAFVWGLAPEFSDRWSHAQQALTSPLNVLTYGRNPAGWNNLGNTHAGNPSVLYLGAVLDLKAKDLVLTIPPTRPPTYLLAQLTDLFLNTVAVPGTRTTPSDVSVSYLLVGPGSRYARQKEVRIRGFDFPVIALDTPSGQLTARVRVDPLAPADAPNSVPEVYRRIVQGFALNSLADFLEKGGPTPPLSFAEGPPSEAASAAARPWLERPDHAEAFFDHLGRVLRQNPLPTLKTGLSGMALGELPPWMVAQPFGEQSYRVPSAGQQDDLALFKPIGLSQKGFKIPKGWGSDQRKALERGFIDGVETLNALVATVEASPESHYWQFVNQGIGIYPNNVVGYLYRAATVLLGAFANLPEDALYAQINTNDGMATLDGNEVYTLTFRAETPEDQTFPVSGIFPPLRQPALGRNSAGFWSLVVYQPDDNKGSGPYISQVSTTNTAYTQANSSKSSTRVLRCDSDDTLTVEPSAWTPLVLSTALLFGEHADRCGLIEGIPYYVATAPRRDSLNGALTFKISTLWRQRLDHGTPIPNSGEPGTVSKITPAAGDLPHYAAIQPVSQLGSAELSAGALRLDEDGSLTLWLAPPEWSEGRWRPQTLPKGYRPIPETNWIPTPSTAYLSSLYGSAAPLNTRIRPMIRLYDPRPGNQPPSLLPCPAGSHPQCPLTLKSTYLLPPLRRIERP